MGVKLTEGQIAALVAQGCRAENWDNVMVGGAFDPALVRNCMFRGNIYIGNGVTISNIGVHIANCIIGDGARIEDVSVIECVGESSFGVGELVATVNEGGGREVPLHLSMTAQTAYMIAMYRHRGSLIDKLCAMIERERLENISTECKIGAGAQIVGCGTLRNVNVGPCARINGAHLLENGSILSQEKAPAVVMHGVRATGFVFSCGSRVEGGSTLRRCYVGEGTLIDDGFTAVDSLFFANCICAAGEACSIFAGPFTVSHHKSSLLIAGLFSFFNAGSGANQSNHLFKTGAVHQGINERGCKYGSNAYVMLPARNGAFNTVLGRHSNHHDTTNFPYSYVMEVEGRSQLVPGAALRSYGTMRDMAKWPARDKRTGCGGDLINFERHNPYIASRMVRAIDISTGILSNEGVDNYSYGRLRIKQTLLRNGRELYRQALAAALGKMLSVDADMTEAAYGTGEWVDIAGMYAPQGVVINLLDGIEAGKYSDMDSVRAEMERIDANYANYAYGWALAQLDKVNGQPSTEALINEAIARGRESAALLDKYARDDAKKDSESAMYVGYGVDSLNPDVIAADFAAVRGIKK